jgi:hypothetical protein
MSPTDDVTTTIDEVIDRFNRAFQERDRLLKDRADCRRPGGLTDR